MRVRAGFIKLAHSSVGIAPDEMKVLEAARETATATGASIAGHILSSTAALAVIDALEGFGCDPQRFIWVHAPYTAFFEPDGMDALLEAASRSAFISDDFTGGDFWVGWLGGTNPNSRHIEVIQTLVDAGYENQILIGSDTGWFDPGCLDPGNPDFVIEPYDQIWDSFLPDARAAGFSERLICKLLPTDPWNAYSR